MAREGSLEGLRAAVILRRPPERCPRGSPDPRDAQLVCRAAVAASVFGAGVEFGVAVFVPEVPRRAGLNELAAPSAAGKAGGDVRGELSPELSVLPVVFFALRALRTFRTNRSRSVSIAREPFLIGGKFSAVWVERPELT